MSQNQQIPPMVQELLAKLQQTQQNLQMIMAQKQQLELEQLETEKALVELNKANDDDAVFKHAGTILIKSNKKDLIEELEELEKLEKLEDCRIHLFNNNNNITFEKLISKTGIKDAELLKVLAMLLKYGYINVKD